MERIEVSKSEREAVENARDAMHDVVMDVLEAHGVDKYIPDLSEVAESIALEGYFEGSTDVQLPESIGTDGSIAV